MLWDTSWAAGFGVLNSGAAGAVTSLAILLVMVAGVVTVAAVLVVVFDIMCVA